MPEIREITEELLETADAMDRVIFPESPWGIESFRDNVRNAYDRPVMAFFGSEPAGFGILRQVDQAEVLLIGVLPKFRKKGIGGAILDELLAGCNRDGGVFLEVREGNEAARKLYESRGFKEIARRKKYYTDPVEDAVIMMG